MTDNEKADAEIERLIAENDRLITACEEWIATSTRLGTENAALREENAELRRRLGESIDSRAYAERRLGNLAEQVKDLYAEMITYSRAPNYNRSVWKPKLEAMGIEVPE